MGAFKNQLINNMERERVENMSSDGHTKYYLRLSHDGLYYYVVTWAKSEEQALKNARFRIQGHMKEHKYAKKYWPSQEKIKNAKFVGDDMYQRDKKRYGSRVVNVGNYPK